MTTRRVLRGVVNDLTISFVGRSNDLDGYWALGQLRTFADRQAIREITFDLIDAVAKSSTHLTNRVAVGYAGWLRKRLVKVGLPRERLRRADLIVTFDAYDGQSPPPQITRGNPFMCSVILVDDNARQYQRVLSSWCGPHDPSREWRRAPEHRGLAA